MNIKPTHNLPSRHIEKISTIESPIAFVFSISYIWLIASMLFTFAYANEANGLDMEKSFAEESLTKIKAEKGQLDKMLNAISQDQDDVGSYKQYANMRISTADILSVVSKTIPDDLCITSIVGRYSTDCSKKFNIETATTGYSLFTLRIQGEAAPGIELSNSIREWNDRSKKFALALKDATQTFNNTVGTYKSSIDLDSFTQKEPRHRARSDENQPFAIELVFSKPFDYRLVIPQTQEEELIYEPSTK